MVRDKLRIRFRKAGDLRLVSHHDLMRCFERMLRRAAIPFHSTEGFNPKPRLVFALSLGLGIVGCEEVLELELDEEVAPEEIRARLAREAAPGLEIVAVKRIDPKVTAQVRRVCYRLPLPPDRDRELPERLAALLAAPECWIERSRPRRRRLDVRPYLRDLRLEAGGLMMDLWVTPTGAGRPDDVLHLLGLGDLLAAGVVLERTVLELHDEIEAGKASEPLQRPGGLTPSRTESPEHPLPAPRVEPVANGASTGRTTVPTPLLPGPLSFEF